MGSNVSSWPHPEVLADVKRVRLLGLSGHDGQSPLPLLRLSAALRPIALNVHLQDRGVVHEPIDGCQRHGLVGENLAPLAERLVGRDE